MPTYHRIIYKTFKVRTRTRERTFLFWKQKKNNHSTPSEPQTFRKTSKTFNIDWKSAVYFGVDSTVFIRGREDGGGNGRQSLPTKVIHQTCQKFVKIVALSTWCQWIVLLSIFKCNLIWHGSNSITKTIPLACYFDMKCRHKV